MSALPVVPVHAIRPEPEDVRWLVHDLWGAAAVVIVVGNGV